jgi:hypothetical protein
MKNFDYIINLIEKKDLTKEESEKLTALLKDDPNLKELINLYIKIKSAYEKTDHPDADLLGEYILFKNELIKDAGKIIPVIPDIEKHLRECEQCREEYKLFNSEFEAINAFVGETITNAEKKSLIKNLLLDKSLVYVRYSLASVFMVGIIYFILFFISARSLSPIQKLAGNYDKTEYYVTRGRASDEFQKSMIALENNNYKRTIEFLEQDIRNNSNDATIFYSYYILGMVYLEDSYADFLNLFPSYNKEKVNKGIINLKECINKNSSDEFLNIKYDAFYFIGKGYLMLDNKKQAAQYFRLVIDYNGSKSEEAKQILDELE